LALFSSNKQNKIHYLPQTNLSALKEQVRDIKWLRTEQGNVLAIAANNTGLLFYSFQNR
jgi:hypothetical protein